MHVPTDAGTDHESRMPSLIRPLLHALSVATAATALASCAGVTSKAAPAPSFFVSQVPAAIAVPAGNKMTFQFRGSGVQNYECRAKASAAGGHDWVAAAPDATLYDRTGTVAGRHYAGPTWEYGDDSKVTGKVVADVAAPRVGDLPWLLLEGTAGPRAGVMSGVTYIQRANTDGGVAPSDPCTAANAGTRKAVGYSADYLFYKP